MKDIRHTFLRLFARPAITWLILFLACISRIIQILFFYSIRFDGSYQYIATQQWLKGKGISIPYVLADDLSTTLYEPLINWPPGYSLLLAPFYWLFGGHYIAAGLTLDIIAALLLIFISRKILRMLDVSLPMVNLFTLFSGFFIYYFYLIASSDAITITIFLIAIWFSISLLQSPEKSRLKIWGILLALWACGSTKYLFIPIVFVIPAFLFIKGWQEKNSLLRRAGIFIGLSLLAGLGGLLLWQKMASGSAAYISEPGRGFFPEHMLDAYPWLTASYLQPDTAGKLPGLQAGTGSSLYRAYQVIHLSLFIFTILVAIRVLRNKGGLKQLSIQGSFFCILLAISLAITVLLGALSIMVPKEEILPGWLWTYIEEPRYYGLVTLLLHMAPFVYYTWLRKHTAPGIPFSRLFVYIPLLLLAAEAGRGVIFASRRIGQAGKEEYYWQYEYRFQQYADSILKNEPGSAAHKVLAGSSHYMNNRVSLYSDIPILREEQLLNDSTAIRTKAPVVLLVIIHERDFPNFKPFLAGRTPVGKFEDYFFYSVYVAPH